jgi:hypothetical protein
VLTVGGDLVFDPGAVFLVDVNGPTAGDGYDQVAVGGAVQLNNATLAVLGGFTPAPGTVLTLIAHGGTAAVAPGFNGLAEGAPVVVGAFGGLLSYAGGNGNDVTVTVPGPATTSRVGTDLVLRRAGDSLDLFSDGALVDKRPLAAVTDYTLAANPGGSLTLDFATGGFFSLGGTVTFTDAGGASVRILGGTVATLTSTFNAAAAGSLNLAPAGGTPMRVSYTGVASLDLTKASAATLTFQLPQQASQAALTDGGDGGVSTLTSNNGTFPQVNYTDPSAALNVNAGSGNDTFTVNRTAPTAAVLTLDGGGGTNSVALDLSGARGPDTITITATGVTSSLLGARIALAATGGTLAGGLSVTGGNLGDTVIVESTPAGAQTTIHTGAGSDTFLVSSDPKLAGSVLSGLGGAVVIDAGAGANRLQVSEAGEQPADKLWISNRDITGTTIPFDVHYLATGGNFNLGVTVYAGNGDDTLFVTSLFPGAPTLLYGRGGNNTYEIAVTTSSAYQLTVDGGSGFGQLFVWDNSGAAVMHDRPSGPGTGEVDVSYLGGASSTIHYQNMAGHTTSVDADSSFIQSLFNDTLGFKAAPNDLAFWKNVLATDGRQGLVFDMEQTAPARDFLVRGWYQRYLGYTPAAGSYQLWVDELATNSEEQVLADFLASDGFAAVAQKAFPTVSSDEAFVRQLYADLLGRPPSDAEVFTDLSGVLPAAGRSGLAWMVLTSQEFRAQSMGARFLTLLGRKPAQAELDFWGSTGLTQRAIDVLFKSSDEFYATGK